MISMTKGNEKTTNQKPKAKPRSKVPTTAKRNIFRSLLMIGIAVALACGYFYFTDDTDTKNPHLKEIPNYSMEKTGSAAIADFTDKTAQINQVVDDLLKENSASLLDRKELKKTVARKSVEGAIKWNCHEIFIAIDKAGIAEFDRSLEKRLDKIGAKILNREPDTYQGQAVMRYDIGIQDKLEDDDVTIIATKVYAIQKSTEDIANLTQEKRQASSSGNGKLALVIDDFGYTKEPIQAYREIHRPLTFAVLPNHPYSNEAAKRGKADGRVVILHLPMEAMSSAAQEEAITIHTEMSESEIRSIVNELTQSVPGISGVNNHQGSKATSDSRVMRIVMNEMADRGLFFIDSHTIGSSVAYDTARSLGVPTAKNELFIDNDSDVSTIKAQLRTAGDIALRDGEAIAIGHARMNTARAIKEMIPELEQKGIEFVFVTSLLR